MRAVLADSGPLYALTVPSDQHHTLALGQIERLIHDRMEVVVMYPILFETYSLLLRRVSPTVAHQWLHETTANGRVIVPANAD